MIFPLTATRPAPIQLRASVRDPRPAFDSTRSRVLSGRCLPGLLLLKPVDCQAAQQLGIKIRRLLGHAAAVKRRVGDLIDCCGFEEKRVLGFVIRNRVRGSIDASNVLQILLFANGFGVDPQRTFQKLAYASTSTSSSPIAAIPFQMPYRFAALRQNSDSDPVQRWFFPKLCQCTDGVVLRNLKACPSFAEERVGIELTAGRRRRDGWRESAAPASAYSRRSSSPTSHPRFPGGPC